MEPILMPVSLVHIREELLPGLTEVWYTTDQLGRWEAVFAKKSVIPLLPSVVTVTPQQALGLAAATLIMKNPVLSRRGMFGL